MTYSPRATIKLPVHIMKFEKLCSDFQVFFLFLGIATQTTWRMSFQLSTLYENVSSLKSLNIVKTYYVKLFFACKTPQYQPTMAPVLPQNVLPRKLLRIKFDWKT